MQRIRTIKPELFKHEELFEAEQEYGLPLRLAYIGLWTCCDREGRFEWRPRRLKTDIMPYDDVDLSRVLDALATRGFIVRYEVDGVAYGCVTSFLRHQVINGREMASKIPPMPQVSDFGNKLTRHPRVNDTSPTRHDLAQGEQEQEQERELEREYDGGGVSAGARDPDFPPTFRERILLAVGCRDGSGMHGPNGKVLGTQADMLTAQRWLDDLGLTEAEVLTVIAETMPSKSGQGPPSSFKYFDKPMANYAGQKKQATEKLKPSEVNYGSNHKPSRQKFGAAINALADKLSAGTITLDNSSRDPFAPRYGGGSETN